MNERQELLKLLRAQSDEPDEIEKTLEWELYGQLSDEDIKEHLSIECLSHGKQRCRTHIKTVQGGYPSTRGRRSLVGELMQPLALAEAAYFPHTKNKRITGGCSPMTVVMQYCPDCQRAERAWKEWIKLRKDELAVAQLRLTFDGWSYLVGAKNPYCYFVPKRHRVEVRTRRNYNMFEKLPVLPLRAQFSLSWFPGGAFLETEQARVKIPPRMAQVGSRYDGVPLLGSGQIQISELGDEACFAIDFEWVNLPSPPEAIFPQGTRTH